MSHNQTEYLIEGAVWMDGKVLPIAEAKIPILDWGFLRSDATYDVVHVMNHKFFRVDDHIARFFAGMERLHMDIGMTPAEVKQAMRDCVKVSGLKDAYVEVICTRGQPAPGSRDPRTCRNKFWAFAIPFVWILDPAKKGLSVFISERQRIPEISHDPTIKNYQWLDLEQGLFEAYDRNADSVLLVDYNGNLCEGPGFNVFVITDNTLMTPRRGVLQGITRRTVLELAAQQGLVVSETDISPATAAAADEVFVTSTAGGIMPVIELDERPVGRGATRGEPGEVTQVLMQRYWDLHDDSRYGEAVFPA